MGYKMKLLSLLNLLLLSTVTIARAEYDHCNKVDVDRVMFQVKLSDGNTYPVVGFHYHRDEGNRTLQVLIHGSTDDHKYWDIPDLNGKSYSYARFMVCHGYSILALDQIGSGESGKPPGDFLNMNETVSALHQTLAQIKDEHRHPVGHFKHLTVYGHSFGAEQAVLVQAQYNQADSIILSGWGHTLTPLPPCPLPPLPDPYLAKGTFTPEMIACFFFYLPGTDPDMIKLDFDQGSTMSRGQFFDVLKFFNNRLLDMSTGVRGPVLVQFADHDALYPAAQEAPNEAKYWTSAKVTVVQYSGIGHSLNAHLNHLQSWEAIDKFLKSLDRK
jgi:pimeloyl-ACP methyl ester carboxylesterase